MAAIAASNMQGAGAKTVTKTVLGASDTFTYNASKNPILELDNITGGALTVTIDGDGGTTIPVAGIGDVTVSGGYSTGSISAGACKAIVLSTIDKYLQGT